MSVSRFKFVSPGVFVNEIDNSQLPAATPARGPVVIGRTRRGPSMRPIAVNSFSEYIEVFGDPVPGGAGGDVWRRGNFTSPMYATYAAEAWLRNGQTATIVRLLGHAEDDTAAAGQAGWKLTSASASYGLFLIDSGSATASSTGTLAAVWYVPDSADTLTLSGTIVSTSTVTASNSTMIESTGADREFVVRLAGTQNKDFRFNFNPDSDAFIRKVFNTNPVLTTSDLVTSDNREYYWLGHSFEGSVTRTLASSSAGSVYGIILQMGGGEAFTNFSDFNFSAKPAETNWIISQDLGDSGDFDPLTSATKLFKFRARDGGDWENTNIKISIRDIQTSPNEDVNLFGSFTVVLRKADDSDSNVQIIEQYNNCNLNPNSEDYIAKRIGDTYAEYSDEERRFRVYGEHPNVSKYVYMDMNEDVAAGATDARLLPFGFYGPLRPDTFQIIGSGSSRSGSIPTRTFASASTINPSDTGRVIDLGEAYATGVTSSFIFPAVALRSTSDDALLSSQRAAFFGYDAGRSGAATRFDNTNIDILRALPEGKSTSGTGNSASFAFTLDDLVANAAVGPLTVATYTSGSRAAGTSITALTGTYSSVIDDYKFNRFTVPMFGGWDGWDIREADPVANRNLSTATDNYAYNTVRRGIDACADPEIVDYNLMVAPGITATGLTDNMINTCENRGDAMAIIDLRNVYKGPQEGELGGLKSRLGTLSTIVSDFKIRRKNSSYGATYYPWVQIRDSINNAQVWVPPSVVALGTLAYSGRVGELWFAPAGFNRGGLSQGSSGLTVTNVSERLTADNRDDLYEANINPIASFPNEGIVIFGQKTLDATTSALNRINVRRLLIFLKKEISRLANQVLFDQNVEATWGRFQALVRPVLESVKVRFGLTDYRLLLDETTTTPDLVDRNVMYAKIFLKPARAIEFIALDFIITRTGAAFED